MRENVKKLIDLMRSENWGLYENSFSSSKRKYPLINIQGTYIRPSDDTRLSLTPEESSYFNSVRQEIFKEWQKKCEEEAEKKLNEYFK